MMAEFVRTVPQVFLMNVAQWPLSATATAAVIMSEARLVQPWPVKRQSKIFVGYLKISALKRFWRNRI